VVKNKTKWIPGISLFTFTMKIGLFVEMRYNNRTSLIPCDPKFYVCMRFSYIVIQHSTTIHSPCRNCTVEILNEENMHDNNNVLSRDKANNIYFSVKIISHTSTTTTIMERSRMVNPIDDLHRAPMTYI
jgi:hypothetical protein